MRKGQIITEEQKTKISRGLCSYYACHTHANKGRQFPNRKRPDPDLGKHYSEERRGPGNPFYGKHHTQQHKEKMQQLYQGITLEKRLGREKAERTRKLISVAHKGKRNPEFAKRRKDPEFIRRLFIGLNKKPTKPEARLISIISLNKLPYKYVGDGQFILGGFCPDFLNTDGRKQVIELFGVYWHDIFDVAEKTSRYAQYGFKTLVIWEDELNNSAQLLQKLRKFARPTPTSSRTRI